jgi:hypothetical protein
MLNQSTQPSEVVDARGTFTVLRDRLNSVDASLAESTALFGNLQVDVTDKRFGAKGDGVAVEDNAINAAIAYLKSKGGGTLYFPAGTYIVDFVLKIDFNVIVKGAGRDKTKIKVKNQSTLFHNPTRDDNDQTKVSLTNLFRDYHAVFFFYDCNFVVSGLEIDGNGANQTAVINGTTYNYLNPTQNSNTTIYKYFHGIQCLHKNLTKPRIEIFDCYIHHFPWDCVALCNRNSFTVSGESVQVYRNILESAAQDILSIHRIDGVKVYDNIFRNPNSHATHLYYNVTNAEVMRNTFIFDDTYFNFAPNNYLDPTFIYIGHSEYDGSFTNKVLVKDNKMYNRMTSLGSKVLYGMQLAKTLSDITIQDNKMYEITKGIFLMNVPINQNNLIQNNEIYYTDTGIVLRPFNSDGSYNGVSATGVTKPFKTGWNLSQNRIVPSSGDTSKKSIDHTLFGTVVTSEISDYLLTLGGNTLGGDMVLDEKNQFRVYKYDPIISENLISNSGFYMGSGTVPIGWLGRGNYNTYMHYAVSSAPFIDVDGSTVYLPVLTINSDKDPGFSFDSSNYRELGNFTPGDYVFSFFAKADYDLQFTLLLYDSAGATKKTIASSTGLGLTTDYKLYKFTGTLLQSDIAVGDKIGFSFNAVNAVNRFVNFSFAGVKLEKEFKKGYGATKRTLTHRTLLGGGNIYGDLDLNKNKIKNIVLDQAATTSRPTSPTKGQMFYDTTLNKPIWHNGTTWTDATGATV